MRPTGDCLKAPHLPNAFGSDAFARGGCARREPGARWILEETQTQPCPPGAHSLTGETRLQVQCHREASLSAGWEAPGWGSVGAAAAGGGPGQLAGCLPLGSTPVRLALSWSRTAVGAQAAEVLL